jgi:uncharacterized protein (TIGR03000 family)
MHVQRIMGAWPALFVCLLLAQDDAWGGEGWETKPYGVPASALPWNQPNYQGYQETGRPQLPATIAAAPEKYTITIAPLPHKAQGVDANVVVLMAHLPEEALIWFQDQPTKSKGKTRYFESPPLTPGKHYVYNVRLAWHENGKWVHKTEKVRVQAGDMHCIYLTLADKAKTIAANLAKLSPEDRKLAEAQKYCPIHPDDRLGVMGVPVKIMLKDQPVFLCCKDCVDRAKADPDKTLAKIKELKEKAHKAPRR